MVEKVMDKIQLAKIGTTFILIVSLILPYDFAGAYSGNVINVGALITDSSKDTGFREWVELKKAGNLLIGRPQNGSINLITVHAADVGNTHLILREINLPGGRKSLFLSAPLLLSEKIQRVTFFVKEDYADFLIYQKKESTWLPIEAQKIQVIISENDNEPTTMYAFSVDKLGLYWLVQRNTLSFLVNKAQSLSPVASSLLGGSISRSLMAWQWSLIILFLAWALSCWVHKIERKSDK